jgi:hypothetical protein
VHVRRFRVGYDLILFSPLLSYAVLALIALVGAMLGLGGDIEGMTLTAWNTAIVTLLVIGIALYAYGYLKREATRSEAKLLFTSSFFFILWGALTYFFASGLYTATVDRGLNPGMRLSTIWDYMEFWTWQLKAILWIGSGFLFAATSLIKIRAH